MHPIASLSDLADIVCRKPEHVPPRPGNIVDLSYPAAGPLPEVRLATDPVGNATMLVRTSVEEAKRLADAARNAIDRSVRQAKKDTPGRAELETAAADLARRGLFAQAVLRTGVFPFLDPRFSETEGIAPEGTCEFCASFTLRPQAELSDYGPVRVDKQAEAPDDESRVDEYLTRLTGGAVRWQDVPDEAQESLERLRDRARRQMRVDDEAKHTAEFMRRCSNELAERLMRDAPTRYVELLRDELAARYAGAVEQSGQAWSDYTATPGFSLDAFKEQMTTEARASLHRGLALDAVARHFAIGLTEEDLLDCLAGVARGHELEAARALYDNGQIAQFVERALRAKTSDFVARRAIRE